MGRFKNYSSSLDAPPRQVRVGIVGPIPTLERLEELWEVVLGPVAQNDLDLLYAPVGKSPHAHQLPEVHPLLLDQLADAWESLLKENLGFLAPLAELPSREGNFRHDVERVEGYGRVLEPEQERLRHVPVVDSALEQPEAVRHEVLRDEHPQPVRYRPNPVPAIVEDRHLFAQPLAEAVVVRGLQRQLLGDHGRRSGPTDVLTVDTHRAAQQDLVDPVLSGSLVDVAGPGHVEVPEVIGRVLVEVDPVQCRGVHDYVDPPEGLQDLRLFSHVC